MRERATGSESLRVSEWKNEVAHSQRRRVVSILSFSDKVHSRTRSKEFHLIIALCRTFSPPTRLNFLQPRKAMCFLPCGM